MGQILSIDYGTNNIGVAISDETHQIAKPLPTLRVVKNRTPADMVCSIVKRYSVDLLVIGLPLGLDAKPTKMSKEIEKFALLLSQRTGVPYNLWNETGTSQMADTGKHKGKRLDKSHSEAARIMLQEYLNYKQSGI